MHTRHGDLDVFGTDQTAAAPPYERLRARALEVEIRGVMLRIAHPEDLIRMKTAASRFRDRLPEKRRQDLEDIVVLERIAAERDAAAARDCSTLPAARPRQAPARARGTRPPARGRRGPRPSDTIVAAADRNRHNALDLVARERLPRSAVVGPGKRRRRSR